jgi:hypothetical protein
MKMTTLLITSLMLLASIKAFGGDKPNTTQGSKPVTITTNSSGIVTVTGLQMPDQPKFPLPYQIRGTRTDIGQVDMKNVQITPQKPPTVMKAVDEAELARQRAQYNACKTFVKEAKSGAYDGRWSQSGVGQAFGFQRTMNANKAAVQCPPELLKARPMAEWEK